MFLADSASSAGGSIAGIFLFLLIIALWFIPTFIAFGRRMPNSVSTFLVNLIPVAGFFIALVYACRTRPQPQYVVPSGWGPQVQPPGFQPPPPVQPQPQPQAQADKPYGYR